MLLSRDSHIMNLPYDLCFRSLIGDADALIEPTRYSCYVTRPASIYVDLV
jgi:hypothetical protein